jgi:hypothetical protein
MTDLRFRQIHLDFHTTQHITGIGAQFDPDEFAGTLAAAHVNSITCFSRCHHGWLYHDSERFPELRHPHLTRNLLAEQIEACHARNIRVPIYITVRWDHRASREHPEWVCRDENGAAYGTRPYQAGFYNHLCVNTSYVDFLEAQTIEVCETLPVDGIFFDICAPIDCSCQTCQAGMKAAGLDASDRDARWTYAHEVLWAFQERLFRAVRSRHPEATVFFNSGHVGPYHRQMIHSFTHLELESLPSGGWGYMHFPVAQRFARNLGVDTMGMTGKFHTAWGDFSSYKNPPALEFEVLHMLALGAKCSIGDQLHPSGKIDAETYKLIGGAYAKVEASEPWCVGAKPLVDIGLLTPEEFVPGGQGQIPDSIFGATRMLQELRQQFDIIDSQSDFNQYRLLILPDEEQVSKALAAKLSAYLAARGKIIASHRSGLNPEGTEFALAELGVKYLGEAEYSPDFIVPDKLGGPRAATGQVMYLKGTAVEALPGSEVLSPMLRPYFNRTWEHFCSHRHTPIGGEATYPGAVRTGNCIYLMHPIFTQYCQWAPLWCKQLVAGALELLLPDPLVQATAPSATLMTLNDQPAEKRLVLHALYYVPERRARELDVIEEVVPIFDIPVSLKASRAVTGVRLVPQGESLPFTEAQGRVEFVIPRIEGQQLVELAY